MYLHNLKDKLAMKEVEEGLTEMDKSQTPPGRDGPDRPGPDKVAKPISAKKFKNHALSILQKSFQARDKKKDVKEAKDAREYDYEGDMAKSQLRAIMANAQQVHDMLEDDTNMAEWVQNKITLAADYISTVADYMQSEVNEQNISELSNNTLSSYKQKAGNQASAADRAGNYALGNKRFKGINQATNKQFDNDLKKPVQGATKTFADIRGKR